MESRLLRNIRAVFFPPLILFPEIRTVTGRMYKKLFLKQIGTTYKIYTHLILNKKNVHNLVHN